MSVRQGMLALLAEQPASAHRLRLAFEHRTGQTWPVNRGQVATTLDRLVRDGLVEPDDADRAPDRDGPERTDRDGTEPTDQDGPERTERHRSGTPVFRLTPAGREVLAHWWAAPVPRDTPNRDELAIKLALAVGADDVDVASVVRTQRTETLRAVRDLRRLAERLPAEPAGDDLAWSLVLDGLTFDAEAELRWLDHVESRLRRAASRSSRLGVGRAPDTAAAAAVRTTDDRTGAHAAADDRHAPSTR